jgi:hypothetical protein
MKIKVTITKYLFVIGYQRLIELEEGKNIKEDR